MLTLELPETLLPQLPSTVVTSTRLHARLFLCIQCLSTNFKFIICLEINHYLKVITFHGPTAAGYVLMSVACGAIKSHTDAQGVGHNLWTLLLPGPCQPALPALPHGTMVLSGPGLL